MYQNSPASRKLSSFILRKLQLFVFKESNPPPFLFFGLFFLHYVIMISKDDTAYANFILGVLYTILFCYNNFFYYPIFLNSQIGQYCFLNMILGLLACNEKWKTYLYMFIAGNALFTDYPQVLTPYIILMSLFISLEIERALTFKTIQENIIYFVGFVTIFFFVSLKEILITVGLITTQSNYIFAIIPFGVLFAYRVIKSRVAKLREGELAQIRDSGLVCHYINMINEEFNNPDYKAFYLAKHLKTCEKPECECKIQRAEVDGSYNTEKESKEFNIQSHQISELYDEFLDFNHWEPDERQLIENQYIGFLIQENKLMKALCLLTKKQDQIVNSLIRMEKFRIKEALREKFQEVNYFTEDDLIFEEILDFRRKETELDKKIKTIMKEKIEFWLEICKPNPSLELLQTSACSLITKIERLHEFYELEIKDYEPAINNYQCTLIYSFYLYGATNQIKYSNAIVQEAQRKFGLSIASQSLASIEGLGLEVNVEHNSTDSNLCLTINNLSNNLAAFFSKKANEMIGMDILELVPLMYRNLHNRRCKEFFNSSRIKLPFRVINKQIPLPFVVSGNRVKVFEMSTSVSHRFEDGIKLLCVLREPMEEKNCCYITLDSTLYYSERVDQEFLLESQEVKNILKSLEEEWNEMDEIFCRKSKIMNQQYMVGSSLQEIFHMYNKLDPVVEITKCAPFKSRKNPEKIASTFENFRSKIEENLQSYQSEGDEGGYFNSHQSIENMLQVLREINCSPFYQNLKRLFLLLILVCFGVSLIGSYALKVNNEGNQTESNPLENLKRISITLNKVIGWEYDLLYYRQENNTGFLQLVKQLEKQTPFEAKSYRIFKEKEQELKELVLEKLVIANDELKQFINSYLNAYSNTLHLKTNFTEFKKMRDYLANYVYDLHLLAQGMPFEETFLKTNYLSTIHLKLQKIINDSKPTIEERFEYLKKVEIVIASLTFLLLMLLLVGLWKYNSSNLEKNYEIFDLLVSINPTTCLKEIKKLKNCEKELLNKPSYYSVLEEEADDSYSKLKFAEYTQEIQTQDLKSKTAEIFGHYFLGTDLVKEETLMQKELKGHTIRKRYGELNLENGQNDPNKFLLLNWMFLVIVVGFFIQGGILLGVKLSFFDEYQAHYHQNLQLLTKIEQKTLLLTNAKVFLDEYTLENRITFHGTDLYEWIEDKITLNNHLLDQLHDANRVYNCEERNLFCQLPYSENIIEGEMKLILSKAYQQKKQFLEGLTPAINYKTRFQLFFAQQIIHYYTQIQERKLGVSVEDLEMIEASFWQRVINLIVINLLYSFLVLICGCCILRWKERQYLRNIFLLSFLNSSMVSENKRIYSFIRRIEKQQ